MKLLIVDDHVVVAPACAAFCCAAGHDSLRGGLHARALSCTFRGCRISLLDLNLPNSSGLELSTAASCSKTGLSAFLVLSMHAEPIYVARTLDAGARGYISKMASADELIAAVRAVGVRRPLCRARDCRAACYLAIRRQWIPLQKLTTREVDIVRLLGEGKNFVPR